MPISLSWQPFQKRPYGEDHYGIQHPQAGTVDAVTLRSNEQRGRWLWVLFGNGPEHTDAEGNQYPLASGYTDTYRQAQTAVSAALNGPLPAVSLVKVLSHA